MVVTRLWVNLGEESDSSDSEDEQSEEEKKVEQPDPKKPYSYFESPLGTVVVLKSVPN